MDRTEKLEAWVKTLTRGTLESILVEVVDRMIDSEEICMYEDNKTPYWDASGERLDGSDDEEDEDDFVGDANDE